MDLKQLDAIAGGPNASNSDMSNDCFNSGPPVAPPLPAWLTDYRDVVEEECADDEGHHEGVEDSSAMMLLIDTDDDDDDVHSALSDSLASTSFVGRTPGATATNELAKVMNHLDLLMDQVSMIQKTNKSNGRVRPRSILPPSSCLYLLPSPRLPSIPRTTGICDAAAATEPAPYLQGTSAIRGIRSYPRRIASTTT